MVDRVSECRMFLDFSMTCYNYCRSAVRCSYADDRIDVLAGKAVSSCYELSSRRWPTVDGHNLKNTELRTLAVTKIALSSNIFIIYAI